MVPKLDFFFTCFTIVKLVKELLQTFFVYLSSQDRVVLNHVSAGPSEVCLLASLNNSPVGILHVEHSAQ